MPGQVQTVVQQTSGDKSGNNYKSVHLKKLVNLKMVGHIRAVQFENIKNTNLQVLA